MEDKIDNCHSLELIFLFFFELDFLDHLMGYQKMEFGLIRELNELFFVDSKNEDMTDYCHSLELIFLFFFGFDFLNYLMVLVEMEAALAVSFEALEDLQDGLQRWALQEIPLQGSLLPE